MSDLHEELRAGLKELIRPSATDVRRATRAVFRVLDDGAAHRTGALIRAALDDLEAPRWIDKIEVTFHGPVNVDELSGEDAVIRHVRGRLAGQTAIAELSAQGLVIRAFDPGGDEPREGVLRDRVRIGIAHHGGRFSVEVDIALPAAEEGALMLATAAVPRWYLEPTLFGQELQGFGFDMRTERALREALTAFRRGLYLAAASLLGVVSEAVWYATADRLGRRGALEAAIREGNTSRVQKLVADRIRERLAGVKGISRSLVDELYAEATLLRDLRNYGVHPGPVRDELEHFFTEEGAGLLILRAHNYLTRLVGAVDRAVTTSEE